MPQTQASTTLTTSFRSQLAGARACCQVLQADAFFAQTRGDAQWRQLRKFAESANAPQVQQFRDLRRAGQQIQSKRSKGCGFPASGDYSDSPEPACGMHCRIRICGNGDRGRNADAAFDLLRQLHGRPVEQFQAPRIEDDGVGRVLFNDGREAARALHEQRKITRAVKTDVH